MFEINVTVTAPEITVAINNLAAAISGNTPVAVPTAEPQPEKATPVQTQTENPTAPVAAAPVAPAQPVPSAPAPSNAPVPTIDTLSRAGAALCEQGKMPQLIELLGKYGVQAVTQLNNATPEVLTAFANDLKALGANL